ncbi:MAG TPA: hypothetical protein VJ777_08150 [Mycobacterium sp.]|nr:hypothetical protein [Mycobacterium sp.]
MTSALVAMSMSPLAIARGDAGNLAMTAATPPPVPPRGSGIRDPRCGTDLFTGIPLPC